MRVQFDAYCLDSDRRELRLGDTLVPTQPQVFDLLEYLIANRDRVVSKDDLISSIWKGRIVSESTLLSRINAARRAIGDDGGQQRLIRTVARKGIRFVGAVLTLSGEDTASGSAAPPPASAALSGKEIQSDVNDSDADKPSIVVLPFKNMSGDFEQEYFVDGLVEDIIAALSKLQRWFVIAGSTSFTYKGRIVEARQIRRELGVRYVVAGSVRSAGGLLRITGEVVDATTGKLIWADRYEGALENVFNLQDSITLSVVNAIAPRMLQVEIARAQAKATTDLSAYDLYLRALAHFLQGKPESLLQAADLLTQAIQLDPNYSSAHGLLASCHINRFLSLGLTLLREEIAGGLQAAKRAIETGRDNAEALARGALGIAVLGGRPNEALIHSESAVALNPNSTAVLKTATVVFSMIGAHTRALELRLRTMQISPLDPWAFETYHGIALEHLFARRFQEAKNWADRALSEKPNCLPALVVKAAAMAEAGFPAEDVADVVQSMLVMRPGISISMGRERTRLYREEDAEVLISALRKAGIPEG